MTTTNPTSQPTRTNRVVPHRTPQAAIGWLGLLVAAACATIASFVIAMISAGSIEGFFLAMAAPIVVGLLVVWRWRRTGIVVLGVVLLAELLSSAPFLADALTHPETPGDFLPLALFTLAAVIGSIVAAGRGVDSVTAQPGDIALATTDFQFDTRTVTTDTGTVAVTVTNDDPTRHTFTIDELGVDLYVPPGTTQRVTFPADAGTYRFYCIPHAPDMAGDLIVR